MSRAEEVKIRTHEARYRRELARRETMWSLERQIRAAGCSRIAGVDEAGRGPLAGPVVVAGVILPPDSWFDGLNDSKKLSSSQRERLWTEIQAGALALSIEIVPHDVIDAVNILKATHLGMRAVLRSLNPEMALIDGLPLPNCPCPQQAVVKGDARSASIAAASILAKVARDRIMRAFDEEYPGYGFARHMGYPTAEHLRALASLGPCPLHRRSFAPVARCDQQRLPLPTGKSREQDRLAE